MISLAQKENGGRHKRKKRTQGLIAFPIVGSSLFSTLIPPFGVGCPNVVPHLPWNRGTG